MQIDEADTDKSSNAPQNEAHKKNSHRTQEFDSWQLVKEHN